MGYIYKLIDEKEIQYAKNGIISLSHPIFEFKGTEGKFINFAKRKSLLGESRKNICTKVKKDIDK